MACTSPVKAFLLAAVGIFLFASGCASLASPYGEQHGRLSKEDTSALNGRYEVGHSAAFFLAGELGGIGVVCPINDRDFDWWETPVTADLQIQDAGGHLAASVYHQDSLIAERVYAGKVNENGFFETETQSKFCIIPALLPVLGWASTDKKSYIGVDDNGDLLLGTVRDYGARILLILGVAGDNLHFTHTYERTTE